MFAPKNAKAETKFATGPTSGLSPKRSTRVGQRLGLNPMAKNVGCDEEQEGDRAENENTRQAPRGSSWDFSKIPLFPPAHASREEGRRKPQATPRSRAAASDNEVPALVHDVLHSPGQALDLSTRALMEPHFGFDFSLVRVHTDMLAAESARAVGARAYTVGQHIAFAPGQFAPNTTRGRRLLLHELTHTLQQRRASWSDDGGKAMDVGPTHDIYETEAAKAASSQTKWATAISSAEPSVRNLRLQRAPPEGTVDVDVEQTPEPPGVNLPKVSGTTLAAVGGTPYATILPGYSQDGDTCGAASLVSALIIWDREHWKPSEPNSRVVTACNLILAEFIRRGDAVVKEWTAHPTPEVRRIAAAVPGSKVSDVFEEIRAKLNKDLSTVRDTGKRPGAKISEGDYQTIGTALYFLWNLGSSHGLSSGAIEGIQNALGLAESKRGASVNIQSFDDIFSSPVVVGLQPDQIVQVGWFVKTGQQHAFLIGRLQSGSWFLSDQGPKPAVEYIEASLVGLQGTVARATRSGSYWLYAGTVAGYLAAGGLIPGWLGVKLLGSEKGVESKAQDLIGSGAFLGEVDAGMFAFASRITRDAFIARVYSLGEAQARFPASSRGGGVILEAPEGVFTLYSTSAVSQKNVSQTTLDASGSKDGVLGRKPPPLLHGWIILGTSSGLHGSWFAVF